MILQKHQVLYYLMPLSLINVLYIFHFGFDITRLIMSRLF
ncbi:hypothetical protein C7382_1062 [Porphyromonas loveana]|uniref:Uncharacterized protein n=1 Tax=Porphyromonas loveana TaxID=1884669 RepID=A0A2U1FH97_9PORP|nr:hypothetical protein C7382_1062 [Porphyromonas loveana]